MAAAARREAVDPRWVRTASDRAAVAAGCTFDDEAAEKPITFIESFCKHSTGRFAGMPFLLEPWQRDFVGMLYGWRRPDGTRRFREAYLEIGKKNGKSTLLAGLALYGLCEEQGAEVYPGATTRKQARIIFNECARMVARSPALRRHLRAVDTTATITFAATNSRLEAMSSDADAQDGKNASTVILDEVHRFRNRKLYDVMKYSGAARSQPLLISITTAGTDRHSLCYQLHKRARAVLDDTAVDVEFLAVIYAADPDDDPDEEATWRKANPSLGAILSIDDFRAEYEQAKRIPAQLSNFLRLRLGIWTEAASRWLPLELWDAGLDPVDPASLLGLSCYAALDLSSVRDLTCLALVFPLGEGVHRTLFFPFMPEETASARADRDGVPYLEWIEAGWMVETVGNATDYGAIRDKLADLRELYRIERVGIDPWNAQQLANDLIEDGFDVVEMRQGFATLSGPAKDLERLLLDELLRHDGNPAARWAVANCSTETDAAGNIKPSKRRSTERIDPVVALVMALGLATAEGPAARPRITVLSPES